VVAKKAAKKMAAARTGRKAGPDLAETVKEAIKAGKGFAILGVLQHLFLLVRLPTTPWPVVETTRTINMSESVVYLVVFCFLIKNKKFSVVLFTCELISCKDVARTMLLALEIAWAMLLALEIA